MTTGVQWRGPLCISKRAESNVIVTDVELALTSKDVFWEKQVLIDAIELWMMAFREVSCGNLKCSCSSEGTGTLSENPLVS